MAEVKWIKITTTMFDDEKIKLIDAMPERDTIFYIWIRLLAQAGKTNAGGYIFLAENIPYTEEMLSTIFNRQIQSVRLALNILKMFGMIDIGENHLIKISNWDKHQNVEGMEKVKEQNRLRKQKQRERQKALPDGVVSEVSVTKEEGHNMSRDSHAIEVDIEVEEDIEEENNTTATTENYLDFFNNNFHLITPFEIETLKSYEADGFEAKAITLALQEAVASSNRNIGYVKKILTRWLQNNIKTAEAVMADKAEFQRNKKTNKNQSFKGKAKDNFNNFEQRTDTDFKDIEKQFQEKVKGIELPEGNVQDLIKKMREEQ